MMTWECMARLFEIILLDLDPIHDEKIAEERLVSTHRMNQHDLVLLIVVILYTLNL